MNLTHVECFLAVAEELHFGRAAERLHRSPATVSEAISALEHILGGALFTRTSRRVQLTDHGRWFLGEVKEPYHQLAQAYRTAPERSRGRQRIRVAHTPELGNLLLAGLSTAPCLREHPVTGKWQPVLMHTQHQLRAVQAGTVDIGLCWSAKTTPPLRSMALREVPLVAVLRADDPLAAPATLRLEQLRGREVLTTPRKDNAFVAGLLRHAFADAGLDASDVREVTHYEELVLQVAAGGLVGLHAATVTLAHRVPDVVFRPVHPTLGLTICAVVREGRTDLLLQHLLQALGEVTERLDLMEPDARLPTDTVAAPADEEPSP
ncbi:LysR family transcriptional regulator [Streptomyces longwoodensis]|uniref:LysR family transcriptional regulator n=1 Tax=Streptomyces longwoodensis TaxID=68231 RepID=UPI0033E660C3